MVGRHSPPDENGAEEEFNKNWYRQGYVYKNDSAFQAGANGRNTRAVCYIPELSDAKYTYEDFLELCEGVPEVAEALYEAVDWQHPETLLDEWLIEGEVDHCPSCGKLFLSYWAKTCPHCGSEYEGAEG